jgi:hypothetical protein
LQLFNNNSLLYYLLFVPIGLFAAGMLSFLYTLLLLLQLALQPLLLIWILLASHLQKNLRHSTRNLLRRLCLIAYRWRVPCIIRIPPRSCASKIARRLCFMAKLSIDLSSAIIIDTGCTQHMFRSRELFITYRDHRAVSQMNRVCGRTPPKAIVARMRVSSSSSPRMASWRWRGA